MDDAPASRQDLGRLEVRVDGKFSALEASLLEAIHDSETRVLKAIYGYTETISVRVDGASKRSGELDDRIAILERRLLEVEKRLNVPPAA